jgi:hypothetical protein
MITDVIKAVESSNNQYALRFEEKMYFHHKALKTKLSNVIKRVKMLNNCSLETALMIMSTSWGFYQILGVNLYSICSYDKDIMSFLQNADHQDKAFYTFCNIQKIDLEKTEEDLKTLTIFYTEIEKQAKSKMELIIELENELTNNRNNYEGLIKFIYHYNGAKFMSDQFIDYLLRMIKEAKKYIKGGIQNA